MVPKKLSHKEAEELFLEIWYEISPETYNALWYPNAFGDQLISDLTEVFPKLYRRILNLTEERAWQRGQSL